MLGPSSTNKRFARISCACRFQMSPNLCQIAVTPVPAIFKPARIIGDKPTFRTALARESIKGKVPCEDPLISRIITDSDRSSMVDRSKSLNIGRRMRANKCNLMSKWKMQGSPSTFKETKFNALSLNCRGYQGTPSKTILKSNKSLFSNINRSRRSTKRYSWSPSILNGCLINSRPKLRQGGAR